VEEAQVDGGRSGPNEAGGTSELIRAPTSHSLSRPSRTRLGARCSSATSPLRSLVETPARRFGGSPTSGRTAHASWDTPPLRQLPIASYHKLITVMAQRGLVPLPPLQQLCYTIAPPMGIWSAG